LRASLRAISTTEKHGGTREDLGVDFDEGLESFDEGLSKGSGEGSREGLIAARDRALTLAHVAAACSQCCQ
jgi:hypothetical protein